MKHQRIQKSSLAFLLASVLLEMGMRNGKIDSDEHPIVMGISLGLILVAIAANVSIVRKMGVPEKVKKVSQWIGILVTVYAFLLYIVFPQ
jgi:hypothetical protein